MKFEDYNYNMYNKFLLLSGNKEDIVDEESSENEEYNNDIDILNKLTGID